MTFRQDHVAWKSRPPHGGWVDEPDRRNATLAPDPTGSLASVLHLDSRAFGKLSRLRVVPPQIGLEIFVLDAVFLHQGFDARDPFLLVFPVRHAEILESPRGCLKLSAVHACHER
jgi:hypothetical protein